VLNALRPTSCVAVVGVGGLGHLAIQFARAWGCEVTAISTSADKEVEARQLGASHFLAARDSAALKSAINRFDLVLSTVNVPLDWDRYVGLLRPGGHLHIVGAVPSVTVTWLPLIVGEKSVGGSPIGSPDTVREMLTFAARHQIKPLTEEYPLSRVNDAVDHLKSGRARYRIVLKNDLEPAR
jgi:uncharacterized zinc-type alcohol dehydrogenase-like protein